MKKAMVVFLIATFIFTVLPFNVLAAGNVSVSGGTYEVGQTFEVNVNIKHSDPIVAAWIKIDYNSSVLSLVSVVGAQHKTGNNTIEITDDDFTDNEKGEVRDGSYKLKFKAIAAGNSPITASTKISVTTREKSTPSTSANITVVTPKPSSNANLASIKLSNGSLSPAFNSKTTNYNATVKYNVDSINITGAVADGKSTYTGGGTFALQVGDNQRVLTVTAEDGTKKSYTINIKRMTEQETLDAEQAERDANPLLVIINNADYTIVNDFTNIAIPTGFTQGTATRKESEITVLNDDSGKYQLCWLTDVNGENGAFYIRDENDNFTKLVYVNANGKMYIVEDLGDYGNMPAGFKLSKCPLDGADVDAIVYEDENLKDFYILNAYVAGQTAYYRFDSIEGTMQRAVDFNTALTAANTEIDKQESNNLFAWFIGMNKTGKTVFIIMASVAVLLIVIAVILIVKIVSPKSDNDLYYLENTNANDFVLNDFADDGDEVQPEPVQTADAEFINITDYE